MTGTMRRSTLVYHDPNAKPIGHLVDLTATVPMNPNIKESTVEEWRKAVEDVVLNTNEEMGRLRQLIDWTEEEERKVARNSTQPEYSHYHVDRTNVGYRDDTMFATLTREAARGRYLELRNAYLDDFVLTREDGVNHILEEGRAFIVFNDNHGYHWYGCNDLNCPHYEHKPSKPTPQPKYTHYHADHTICGVDCRNPFITTNRHVARGRYRELCARMAYDLMLENEDMGDPVLEAGAGFTRLTDGTTIRWYGCGDPGCKHYQVKPSEPRAFVQYKSPSSQNQAIIDMVSNDLKGEYSLDNDRSVADKLFIAYEKALALTKYLRKVSVKAQDKAPFLDSYITARKCCIELRQAIFDRDDQ